MKETEFIRQNKDKWERFEQLASSPGKNPEELSSLFIEITNDLSYAKTHYPRRTVRVYLNNLAKKVFLKLYRQSRTSSGSIKKFWTFDLPLEMYRARWSLLLAFLFLTCAALLGVVSTMNDISFPEVMLGEDYVRMTERNINQGDPMAVYKSGGETYTFLWITINNIRVSFIAFILGIFFGLGTLYILANNGIMLGAFQYFFHLKGLFLTSFLTIWIHGALEISAIVIAGAAGLTLGKGLIFTGSYSRTQSLYQSAKSGVRIMIGLVPIFIAAGFLEGFVTRHTDMPNAAKATIIGSSFIFIIGYFVVYPWLKFRKNTPHPEPIARIPVIAEPIELDQTQKPAQIFTNTFRLVGSLFSSCWKWMFVMIAAGVAIWMHSLYETGLGRLPYERSLQLFHKQFDLQQPLITPWFWALWIAILLSLSTYSIRSMLIRKGLIQGRARLAQSTLPAIPIHLLLVVAIVYMLVSLPFQAWMLLPAIIQPIVYLAATPGQQLPGGIAKTMGFSFRGYTGFLGNFMGIALIGFALFVLLADPFGMNLLSDFFRQVINWHLLPGDDPNLIYNTFLILGWMLFAILIFPVLLLLATLHIYSSLEEDNASGLKKRIATFGATDKRYEKFSA